MPGPDRAKVRGEERFSVFSLEDKGKEIPESLLSSQTIQVWPMTEGTISGITPGELVRFTLPPLTVTLKDLYPSSTTYVRASKGDGTPPKVISGSALVVNESDPTDRTLTVEDNDSVFDSDGTWTLELVTVTPFGTDLVGSSVTFELDRTIEMNGSFTTVE